MNAFNVLTIVLACASVVVSIYTIRISRRTMRWYTKEQIAQGRASYRAYQKARRSERRLSRAASTRTAATGTFARPRDSQGRSN